MIFYPQLFRLIRYSLATFKLIEKNKAGGCGTGRP
jgi:hypothetical protein